MVRRENAVERPSMLLGREDVVGLPGTPPLKRLEVGLPLLGGDDAKLLRLLRFCTISPTFPLGGRGPRVPRGPRTPAEVWREMEVRPVLRGLSSLGDAGDALRMLSVGLRTPLARFVGLPGVR